MSIEVMKSENVCRLCCSCKSDSPIDIFRKICVFQLLRTLSNNFMAKKSVILEPVSVSFLLARVACQDYLAAQRIDAKGICMMNLPYNMVMFLLSLEGAEA